MSFSKCSNLEDKNVIYFKLWHPRDKGLTIISNKQNLENKAFLLGFMHLKIKIKEIQTENKTSKDKNLKIS